MSDLEAAVAAANSYATVTADDVKTVHGEFRMSVRAGRGRVGDFRMASRAQRIVTEMEEKTGIRPLHLLLLEIRETPTRINIRFAVVEATGQRKRDRDVIVRVDAAEAVSLSADSDAEGEIVVDPALERRRIRALQPPGAWTVRQRPNAHGMYTDQPSFGLHLDELHTDESFRGLGGEFVEALCAIDSYAWRDELDAASDFDEDLAV